MSKQPFNNRIVGQDEVSPDKLLANPKNWRTHPEFQQKSLEAVLKQVGWVQRVVVNKKTGLIVDGHLRVELAKKRNEPTVPVVYVELSEDEEALILTTLDPISQLAGTDGELLAELLNSIETSDNDILALLDTLKTGEAPEDGEGDCEGGLTDPDDVPAPPAKEAISKRGDVWVLGKHRVMCGDSTNPNDVRVLMDGKKADCVWTDPPYGVSYSQKTRSISTMSTHRNIENDDLDSKALYDFLLLAFINCYNHIGDGCPIYVAHADSMAAAFRNSFNKAGFKDQGNVLWVKNTFTLGRMDYQQQHEPIMYGWKPTAAHKWYGDRKQRSVQEIAAAGVPGLQLSEDGHLYAIIGNEVIRLKPEADILQSSVIYHEKPRKNDLHPTMKPVSLVEKMVLNSTKSGDVVLDLFGGSGSTLIACAQSGRAARLMEFDPLYVDVIVKRWQEFTGKQATREEDGYPFDDLVEEAEVDAKNETERANA